MTYVGLHKTPCTFVFVCVCLCLRMFVFVYVCLYNTGTVGWPRDLCGQLCLLVFAYVCVSVYLCMSICTIFVQHGYCGMAP